MEQVKDFRLNATPKGLLIVCAALLLSRLGLALVEFIHPAEKGRPVSWIELNPAANASANATASKSSPETATASPAAGKIVLYEFYADWCDPCKRLERDVMTNSEIRSLIEKNFATLRVTDRQREDGKNSPKIYELQKRYRVFAFPTLVAVGPDGEAIESLVGNSSSLAVYRFVTRVVNKSSKAH